MDVMTEIEELIVQARQVLKEWKPPQVDDRPRPQTKSWRRILEDRQIKENKGY